MHSLSHSLAHRGPGASRTRPRFQPYSSTAATTSTPSTRSPQSYLHTPSSISSSTPSTSYISPLSTIERARKTVPNPTSAPLSQAGQCREAQKSKYVTRLIDQAVISLGDIWRPEDIPPVFRTTSHTAYSAPMPSDVAVSALDALASPAPLPQVYRNVQLPSPISPTTRLSPVYASPLTPTTSISADVARSSHLIPIRGFVHEVLRRSRTSTGVLQTALCYLEAVRAKVPELLRQENMRVATGYVEEEQDAGSRITIGTAADYEEASAAMEEFTVCPGVCPDLGSDFMDVEGGRTVDLSINGPPTAPLTEPLLSMDAQEPSAPPAHPSSSKKPSPPLPPLPRLPSPLLCPRRTFLACLILASKFMQDRSYSNRAWAKLAGLPPREIGRCERALGEALEWRLWVGKGPAPTSVPAPGAGAHRAVTRCRSEAIITQAPTCPWPTPTSPISMYVAQGGHATSSSAVQSGIRRSSTMPSIGSDGSIAMGGAQVFSSDAFSMSLSSLAVLDRRSSMDTMPGINTASAASSSWSSMGMQTPSPSLSTPTLTYSPASTASSEDGERTIHMSNVMDISSITEPVDFVTKPASSLDFLPRFQGWRPDLKLPAIEPMVVNAPVQLPPLSDAVFNPVLIERSVGSASLSGLDNGVDVSGSDFYSTYATWSVPSRS